MTRCDENGTPKVVQTVKPGYTGWEVEIFNGLTRQVDYEFVPPEESFDISASKVEAYVNQNLKEFLR